MMTDEFPFIEYLLTVKYHPPTNLTYKKTNHFHPFSFKNPGVHIFHPRGFPKEMVYFILWCRTLSRFYPLSVIFDTNKSKNYQTHFFYFGLMCHDPRLWPACQGPCRFNRVLFLLVSLADLSIIPLTPPLYLFYDRDHDKIMVMLNERQNTGLTSRSLR